MSGFTDLIDLASERLGGRAIAASDEFYAGKENLLKAEKPVFIAGKFTARGKWMDGWESRRKRGPGHDWCIIALGRAGTIAGVNVDTSHFNGNQPESCTVEGCELHRGSRAEIVPDADVGWTPVVARTPLRPGSEHLIEAAPEASGRRLTHVRLNLFPDGGVARLRVHGMVLPDWERLAGEGEADLAAAVNGGLVVAASDMHFGSRHNLIMPGRAENMGDGWETRRRRGLSWEAGVSEHDWAIVRLGHRGTINRIKVDTDHFKGNFPESCSIEACDLGRDIGGTAPDDSAQWADVVGRTKLRADTRHFFEKEIVARGPFTHVRLKIYPDGGVARLRVWGEVAPWTAP